MASKQLYPCFSCRRVGYEIPVYLDGKDAEGRTKYLNEDGTKHIHKTKQELPQQSNPLATLSDESVDSGMTAFSMMTDLIRLVEQTQKRVVTVDEKLNRLLNLVELRKK
jgi:hypothetical protein